MAMDEEKEWFVGDRVYVPRIATDESIHLTIVDFLGDEDVEDPDVSLMLKEFRGMKQELIRCQYRACKFSELREVPTKITKGGAIARMRRGLVDVYCQCGCGQVTSGGMFKQGHDAKLKSKLRKIMDGHLEGDAVEAEAELRRRNWLS